IKRFLIRLHNLIKTMWDLLREIHAEHTTYRLPRELDASRFGYLDQTIDHLLGSCCQTRMKAFCLNQLQGSQTSCHCNRVARKRACLINRTQWGEMRHDVFAATKRTDWQTTADDFA